MRENVKPIGWKMGLNAYFAGMSRRSIMQRFGAELDWHSDKRKDENLYQSECPILPEQFDARNQWTNCKWIGFIRDQSNCGSCWAVSGASVMSDRHCIASNGTNSPYLSDEELLSCCHYCAHGCRSGKIEAAFIYWQRSGLVTGGPYGEKACCLPYSISPCTMCRPYMLAPKCQRTCQARKNHYYVNQDEFDIMQEIYQRGPVVAGFKVYHDFLYYISGSSSKTLKYCLTVELMSNKYRSSSKISVYRKSSAYYLGNHAVKIIGWGKENSIPYWLIANSWNNTFGENGFARILRGKDECRIESAVFAGIPSLLRQRANTGHNTTISITNNQVPILTVVLRALFVHVTNYAFSGSLRLCVQANIGPHKFIALSNNDNQRETVLLNELNNNNAQAAVDYTAHLRRVSNY
ncbi:Cathepsin B-like cysteine proteinase 3 [Trichinella papuae]|uniref:Cathepsin B-like cysteine proteinase 3 n=1 Tax=Trichinella papuae TaxID=268474 RepID=A0A0V1M2P0_9BILA|nr:Cathepsin B-like cysteine proteinase 3 [Trichinella papuae]